MPKWLSPQLLENGLPWHRALEITPEKFNNYITLHDSNWVKIVLDSTKENSAILAFRWDAYWNKQLMNYVDSKFVNWPILLIKLYMVKKIECIGYTGLDDVDGTISGIKVKQKIDSFLTKIKDVNGNRIVFTHTGNFGVLCYSSKGEFIDLKKE